MPKRRTKFVQGHYYHIYNRGANRNNIFFSKENYFYCLRLMKTYLRDKGIAVIAYCLMPNHYHFLLRPDSDVSLQNAVGGLFKSYVMAVNNQTGRSGTLFAGRFRDAHVDNDGYLLHLCRYIHGNPVKAGMVSDPKDWPYSNYLEWVGERNGSLVDMDFVAEMCQGLGQKPSGTVGLGTAYREFVLDYLRGVDDLIVNLYWIICAVWMICRRIFGLICLSRFEVVNVPENNLNIPLMGGFFGTLGDRR